MNFDINAELYHQYLSWSLIYIIFRRNLLYQRSPNDNLFNFNFFLLISVNLKAFSFIFVLSNRTLKITKRFNIENLNSISFNLQSSEHVMNWKLWSLINYALNCACWYEISMWFTLYVSVLIRKVNFYQQSSNKSYSFWAN